MAPKKKEKNLKRSNIITLKLTDIELAVLNEAADVTGLSRSEYVRKLLLEKQINHQIEVVADMNDLRKLDSDVMIGSIQRAEEEICSTACKGREARCFWSY